MLRSEGSESRAAVAGAGRLAALHEMPAALPQPLTSFVGRAGETEQMLTLLQHPQIRLLTLTGPGGVGKTRLAVRVAGQFPLVAVDYEVAFISLAAVAEPDQVLVEAARQLGLRAEPRDDAGALLAAALRGRRLLVVLDNLEHLWSAGASFMPLLAACPHLKLLVTSRRPLRVSGEHLYVVPPLAVPLARDGAPVSPPPVTEAMQLFTDRAQAVRGEFELTSQNGADVAAICRRLDGLPLAIELAAARSNALSPRALLALLESRLMSLATGHEDAAVRHRTLRQTIAWSVELLEPERRRVFARLSVFAGGFSLRDAGAVVAGDEASPAVLASLLELLEHSLIVADRVDPADDDPRFFMLETIREVALSMLEESGELETVRRRHAERFQHNASELAPELNGSRQREWLNRLERDIHNIRAALAWGLIDGEAGLALALATELQMFWLKRAHVAEGRAWICRALDAAGPENAPLRLAGLAAACMLAGPSGDSERATEGLALARDLGDRRLEGRLLLLHGSPIMADRPEEAASYLERALALHDETQDLAWRPATLAVMGLVAARRGQATQAMATLNDAIDAANVVGERWMLAHARQGLAVVARFSGDPAASLLQNVDVLREAIDLGDGVTAHEAVVGMAGALCDLGHLTTAARMLGAAEVIREEAGLSVNHLYAADQYERDRRTVVGRLGEPAARAAWSAGRAMTPGALVDLVATLLPSDAKASARQPSPPRHARLTAREQEVLRLLVERRTDREISQILFIGLRTVEFHVANVLAKLDADNRYEVAVIAGRRGLL